MASVWWVEGGEYSSWRIKAIFSTKEKATEYVRVHNASCPKEERISQYDIKEKPLDAPFDDTLGEWMVHISVEGKSLNEYGTGQWSLDGFDRSTPRWFQRRFQGYELNGLRYVKKDEPVFIGFGKTKEHARRSAEDLRREYIATYGKRYVPPPEEGAHG